MMKNFLVDALRQADADGEESAESRERVDEAGDRQLSMTGNDEQELRDLEALELQADPAIRDVNAETDSYPELNAELVEPAGDSADKPLLLTEALGVQGASMERRHAPIDVLGRLAPVLCLVAMCASAGGYLLLNHLTTSDLNEDLDGLSQWARSGMGGAQSEGNEMAAADFNFLDNIVAEDAASVAPQLAGPKHPQNTDAKNEAGNTAARVTANSRTDPVSVGVTRNPGVAVDDRAYALVVRAFTAYRAGNYTLAEETYRQALSVEPNHADALAGLAAVFQRTGRAESAAETYQRLLGVDPGNTVAASALISLRSKETAWDTESGLKLLLQRFPEAAHLHFALGSFFVGQGRWADARHEFLEAHRLAPDNADYSFNVAVSMEQLGEFDDARHFYETALDNAGDEFSVDRNAVLEHLNNVTVQSRTRQ